MRRYLKATDKPKYTYKKPRHKVIEDYADFINEKLKEAPYSAVRIKELLGFQLGKLTHKKKH